jgi:hypothetical protein
MNVVGFGDVSGQNLEIELTGVSLRSGIARTERFPVASSRWKSVPDGRRADLFESL